MMNTLARVFVATVIAKLVGGGALVRSAQVDLQRTHPDVISLLDESERNAAFFVGQTDPNFAAHEQT